MLTFDKRHDIGYYVDTEDADTLGDAFEYYARHDGTRAGQGHWWTSSPLALLANGAVARPEDVRMLASGRMPPTGRQLVQAQSKTRVVAYDFSMHTAKAVSVLYAVAPELERKRILEAHQRAMRYVFDAAWQNGHIVTRRGREGRLTERPTHVVGVLFDHLTNRLGDPFLHGHGALLNVGLRADGTAGTIDVSAMLVYQGFLGMLYAGYMADALRAMGYAIERDGQSFTIVGIPEEVCTVFSKRRAEIERYAAEHKFRTARDRVRAQIAALATRSPQVRLSPAELQAQWDADMARVGWTAQSIYDAARAAGAERRALAAPDESALIREYRAAIDGVFETDVRITHANLCRLVAEIAQGLEHPDAVARRIAQLISDGTIVEIGHEHGRPVYSTPKVMSTERQLLLDAEVMRGQWSGVSETQVTQALAEQPQLSDEQCRAVRHALAKDGISIVEGSAGSGKSTLLLSVTRALEAAGYRILLTAPSWKATHNVRKETGAAEDVARAIQGMAKHIRERRLHFAPRDVIVIDEAGMVATDDMAVLVAEARRVGAKIILAGDTRQLQPVGRGAPMRLLARRLGTRRVEDIRRQRVQWQRDASRALACGQADDALEAYDRNGRILWATDADAAMDRLVGDWRAGIRRRPADTWLVLASRNCDVHALNAVLRETWEAEGRLHGPHITVPAWLRGGRNGRGYPGTLTLAVGDRVVMGEIVEVQGHTLYTSDIAVIEDLDVSDANDPLVRLRVEGRDVVVTERWSRLRGARKRNDKNPAPPKIQHGYAMTIHMAQGQTEERSFLYAAARKGAESAYVGLTRHRADTRVYVDTERVRDTLAKRGHGVATLDELKLHVFENALLPDFKANVADYCADMDRWLHDDDFQAGTLPVQARPKAERLRERMAARLARPQLIPLAPLTRQVEQAARVVDLTRFAADHGWRLRSTDTGATELEHPSAGVIVVERHMGRDTWRRAGSAERHTVWSFCRAFLRTPTLGHARALLARWLKRQPAAPAVTPDPTPKSASVTPPWHSLRQELPHLDIDWNFSKALLKRHAESLRMDDFGKACLARRNAAGDVVGYTRVPRCTPRAPNPQMSIVSSGGPGVVMVGDRSGFDRLVVCTSGLDAMALIQQRTGAQGRDERTLYIGLDCRPGTDEFGVVRALIERRPDAELVLALNMDEAGKEQADAAYNMERDLRAMQPARPRSTRLLLPEGCGSSWIEALQAGLQDRAPVLAPASPDRNAFTEPNAFTEHNNKNAVRAGRSLGRLRVHEER